jgi:hypothetical protein
VQIGKERWRHGTWWSHWLNWSQGTSPEGTGTTEITTETTCFSLSNVGYRTAVQVIIAIIMPGNKHLSHLIGKWNKRQEAWLLYADAVEM